MSFSGKYILAAIDGTSSRNWKNQDWSNSHTFRFYNDFNPSGGNKKYFEGPGGDESFFFNPEKIGILLPRNALTQLILPASIDMGTFVGMGTDEIIKDAISFITKNSKRITGQKLDRRFLILNKKDQSQLRKATENKLRICLIGHSRGAYACIAIAYKLPLPVYFMGLYDAVDRHFTSGDIDPNIIRNVDYVAHALRSPKVESRTSFGNTGKFTEGKKMEMEFFTTHGGIGGAYDPYPKYPLIDDLGHFCDASTLAAAIQKTLGYDRKEECESQSEAADIWLRDRARALGLKV
ncbi:MAG: DUF2235 domain-containing protein [Lewinellaceae bacterium]|nr:DUF2235 domain-containing protein [Lewinellaceae bacterium]